MKMESIIKSFILDTLFIDFSGISKELSSAMPYMYSDTPEWIKLIADACIVDQIVDWFGTDVRMSTLEDQDKVSVEIKASPNAMEHWAMQYINHVEIISPESLRNRIKEALESGLSKYKI